MSIISSGRASTSPSGSTTKLVRFKLDYNLKSLFQNFVNEKDRNLYDELVSHIRDVGQEIRDDDLAQLLREARGCVSILDANFRLFVQVVLILRWTHRSGEVISEYQGFLLDLCSAHNVYTKLVIEHLVKNFKSDASDWIENEPSETCQRSFSHLHQVIKSILAIIPMSRELLLTLIESNYPFVGRPALEHLSYAYNVLHIVQYEKIMRCQLLKLVIRRCIMIDAKLPRWELESWTSEPMEVEGEVFPMDEAAEPTKKTPLPKAEALDLCLLLLFNFIKNECFEADKLDWDRTKTLYIDLVQIFDEEIITTHATNHVQFLLFYFLSFKYALVQSFLQMLWKKVTNPNLPLVIRQVAVCYIASLLARAGYAHLNLVQDALTEMTGWIHSYIDNQDGSNGASYPDSRIHGVFYSTCQALFYVIAFRYKDLVHNKGLIFLQGLGLSKIVTCRLNPLRVCLPVVVSNFASIARSYQLAYCYAVIERNERNSLPTVHRENDVLQVHLESFFPFDPYLLEKSKVFIEAIYREYTKPPEKEQRASTNVSAKDEDNDDDFLDTSLTNQQNTLDVFSYSTSPGFLHI